MGTADWDDDPLQGGFYAHIGDWMRVTAVVSLKDSGKENLTTLHEVEYERSRQSDEEDRRCLVVFRQEAGNDPTDFGLFGLALARDVSGGRHLWCPATKASSSTITRPTAASSGPPGTDLDRRRYAVGGLQGACGVRISSSTTATSEVLRR